MSRIKKKFLVLLLVAIAVNLALALLPIYDSVNIRCWLSVGSSLSGAVPAMANSPWPGGFFSFTFFVPLYVAYMFSAFNLYFSVVVLKLILFVFTLLTAMLLYRITQKVKPAYAEAVMLFTLLNPAVLYVNYIWAQVDILPVFFFTLGYALIRYVDFGGNNIKRYLIGFIPIVISAFIYRYALILIPTLFFFGSESMRNKLSASAIAIGEVAAFFGLEFLFFRGGNYDYLGALSGLVINNSTVEGFQYWVQLPQLPYILFLVTLTVAVPLLLKRMRLREPATLFIILMLFIYTSRVQLPDYYLWLYPLGVLVALTAVSRPQFNRRMLLTNLPIFVGLFFISFIIGNGEQAGLFYFAYPLLHQDIIVFSTPQSYATWVMLFNLFLLGSVVAAAAFCLSKTSRKPNSESDVPRNLWHWSLKNKPKRSVLLAAGVLLLVALGFVFSAALSAPVSTSQRDVFPLYLFTPEGIYDCAPMFSTYYLSWAGLVVFNDWSQTIPFNHSLSQQDVDLNLSFDLNTSRYASYTLLRTDNMTAGVSVEPRLKLSDLSAVTPDANSSSPENVTVSLFDVKAPTYKVGAGSYSTYNLDAAAMEKTYTLAFKLQNASSTEHLQLIFRNTQCLLQLSIWGDYAVASCYDFAAQHSTYAATTYTSLSDWNLLEFAPAYNGFFCWINNEAMSLQGGFFRSDTNLMVTSVANDADFWLGGNVTQLYCSQTKPEAEAARTLFVEDDLGEGFTASLSSGSVNFSFASTPQNCTITYRNYTYIGPAEDSMAFGKLTAGTYGFSVRLNHLLVTQNSGGYYLLPVYFAVAVPFAVALLSLLMVYKPLCKLQPEDLLSKVA